MWCFIMEMVLCGVLCWIITSRCLGSQGLADIKACRVLGRQWHGGVELGPLPAGWGWWHQDWVGRIHFTLAESCSHSATLLFKRIVFLFFFEEIKPDPGELWRLRVKFSLSGALNVSCLEPIGVFGLSASKTQAAFNYVEAVGLYWKHLNV